MACQMSALARAELGSAGARCSASAKPRPPFACFARPPELPHSRRKTQLHVGGCPFVFACVKRSPDVVVFQRESTVPTDLVRSYEPLRCRLSEGQTPFAMPFPHISSLTGCKQPLGGVGTHRLEEPVSGASVIDLHVHQ